MRIIFLLLFSLLGSIVFSDQYSIIIYPKYDIYKGRVGLWYRPRRRDENIVDIAIRYGVDVLSIIKRNALRSYVIRKKSFVYIPLDRRTFRLFENLDSISEAFKNVKGFILPVKGEISSVFGPRWGSFHFGLDIAAPNGTVIRAARSGKVEIARWFRGYGLLVKLDHEDGFFTYYGHCSRILVKEGDYVRKGEEIAYVGATGRATGPHLHFEIRYLDVPSNPLFFLFGSRKIVFSGKRSEKLYNPFISKDF